LWQGKDFAGGRIDERKKKKDYEEKKGEEMRREGN